MRTYEERTAELHLRMRARRAKLRSRNRAAAAGAIAACLSLTVLFAFAVSGAPVRAFDLPVGGTAASIFAQNGALGYVLVALLAFCLGVAATLLCRRLKLDEEGGDKRNARRH